jgi:hypothetical protein
MCEAELPVGKPYTGPLATYDPNRAYGPSPAAPRKTASTMGHANGGQGFELVGGRQTEGSASVIGCVDLRTDQVLWEAPTRRGLTMACFSRGSRLLTGAGQSAKLTGLKHILWIWDALEGKVLEEVKGFEGHGHGISRGPTGRFVYPEIYKYPIKLFDVKRKAVISLAEAFSFDSLDDFEGWWAGA